ncbi:hypothetical protein SELMODRAFT_439768 [Selaginella moellendorffii]|uniref:Cyanovirin-N domain-containing protein n=1 Tax=Selaginella moellendorffii TaxID=88036 RepID=D8R751_SELML|nr:hypothetical protein SELMODRAFT_439768 [Selaginella moellendorffii]
MGSYLSVYNNTTDTYVVKVGPDQAAVRIATIVGSIVSLIGGAGAALTTRLVANGVVRVFGVSTRTIAAATTAAARISIPTTVVGSTIKISLFITKSLKEKGYVEIQPGEKHVFGPYSLSLWQQAACRRIRVNPDNKAEVLTDVVYMRPIFSGATKDSVLEHNIQHWINKWGHEERTVITLDMGNFSKSSKDISFKDGKLHAKCQTTRQELLPSSIDLNYFFQNIDGIVQLTASPPGNFLATCRNVQLKGGNMLVGIAKKCDHSETAFELDFDIDIVNKEGKLGINTKV